MGGKRQSSSKSFFSSLFNFSRRSRHNYRDFEVPEQRNRLSRVWASDEDCGRYIGQPDIDRKATEFIARFHETRATESELQTVKP